MVPQAPQLRYKHKYSPNQHCMLSDPSPFLCSDSHCIFIYHFSTHIPGAGAHLQGPVTTIVKHPSTPMRDIYCVSKLSPDFSSLHHFYTHTTCRLPALRKMQLCLETDAGKLFGCLCHSRFFGRERKNRMKN